MHDGADRLFYVVPIMLVVLLGILVSRLNSVLSRIEKLESRATGLEEVYRDQSRPTHEVSRQDQRLDLARGE